MKNLCLALLAVAVLGLSVVLVQTQRQLNQRTAELQILKAAKPAPLPKPPRVATLPSAQPSAQPAATPAVKTASAKTTFAAFGTNFMSALAGMMKSPAMKEQMKMQQKVAVEHIYGDLLKSLNLSDEQKKQFQEMLVERQQFMAEAGLTMLGGSAEEKNKAVELIKEAKTGYEQVVQDLFGAETAETFKQYEERLPEHNAIGMYKNSLAAGDALSPQQEADLVTAFYEERKNMPSDSLLNKGGQPPDPAQLSEEGIVKAQQQLEQLQQRNLTRAATILNPAQLESFKQYQKQMATMQAFGLKMAAQMFSQPKAGGAATPAP